MLPQNTTDTPAIPLKTEEKPHEPTLIETLRPKSIRQIVEEAHNPKPEAPVVAEPEKTPLEAKAEETKKDRLEEKRREKEKADQDKIDAVAKKTAEEVATRVTEESKKAFQDEIQKILDKDKNIEEKQKEADELIAVWDKEQRLPKNYKELIDETLRIATAKVRQEQKQVTPAPAPETPKVETPAPQAPAVPTVEEQINQKAKEITSDLDNIIAAGYLPKMADPKELENDNTKDPGAIAAHKLFQFGMNLNTRLKNEGKNPVTSLKDIYFLHYVPYMKAHPEPANNQPAGANAPVAGANNTPTNSNPNAINYPRLHKETWAQTISRIAREARTKVTL